MILAIIISLLTIFSLIISILKFPTIKIKDIHIPSFFVVTTIGALLLIICRLIDINEIFDILKANNSINPLKILVLFISMSLISIVLDEAGFFKYLANKALSLGKKNQKTLFISFYFIISVLTVFTSNDIIILTFTPFICFFCKRANINPLPYLVSEFVAANTFSMMLCIGNPTNIYLSTVYEIGFFDYFKVMALPSLLSGLAAFIVLFILFKKDLNNPLNINNDDYEIHNKFVLITALIHLILCTILLTISNFIAFEMWLICFIFASSLLIILLIYSLFSKDFKTISHSLLRAPWNLIPFILSMFIIILCLDKQNVLINIGKFFNTFIDNSSFKATLTYGISSTLLSNIVNNIPMTLGISKILFALPTDISKYGIYASIIGSNIGAYLSPIGALAGILFMNIVKSSNVKYKAIDFIKYGIIIVPVTLIVALLTLYLVL